jgi:hypothetical protein
MKKHLRIVSIQPPWSENAVYFPDRAVSHTPSNCPRLISKRPFHFIDFLFDPIQPAVFRFETIHPVLFGLSPQINSTIAQPKQFSAARAKAEYISLNAEELNDVTNHFPFSGL